MWILFDVACIAFLLCLVLTPLVRGAGLRLNLVDRPDSRKLHKAPVPRLGGVAVMAAYVCALLFILIAPYQKLQIDIPAALSGALALAPAAALVFAIGLLDDIVGLRPWQKLIGECVAAVMAYFGGFAVHVFRGDALETWVSLPVTVLWLVACANAVNLIDGMDGLAAGVGFFAAATTLVAALTHGNIELALVTAPLVGSLVGFLRYNFNPASIFLGDCGSLLIGFLLGCYGAVWSHKSATVLGMTAPLIALAIPLLDVLVAIARRFLRGQPIFSADRGHIHHRLLDQGLTPRRAALILYAVCGAAAAVSLLQDMGQTQNFGGLIVVLFCAVAWLGVQNLGYTEFNIAGRFFFQRGLRRTIAAQMWLQDFERRLSTAGDLNAAWQVLSAGSRDAGFCRIRMETVGDVLDCHSQTGDYVWELRIPLRGGGNVVMYRESQAQIHPVIMTGFPEIVQRQLVSRQCYVQYSTRCAHGPRVDRHPDEQLVGVEEYS
jgi:UDP-GlcNAc:undecaprenyl-phosphate GlcNAc-1-phosphate transferase